MKRCRRPTFFILGVVLVAVVLLVMFYCLVAFHEEASAEGADGVVAHTLPPFSLFDAERNTLVLQQGELQHVRRVHQREVSYDDGDEVGVAPLVCPNRYIFVNTHTYGRHHNQLQEVMNVIVWARRLNRTAVLGWFRAHKRWIHSSELYDFSKIARRYCVVSAELMLKRLGRRGPLGAATLVCYGQCVHDTPLERFTRQLQMLHDTQRLPPYFSSERFEPAVQRAIQLLHATHADVVALGGEYGFFLRTGIAENAAIYGLLQPAASVRRMLQEFLDHTFSPRSRYIGVHKRHREATCHEEMNVVLQKIRKIIPVGEGREQLIRAQCNISIPYLAGLHASLGLKLFSFPLFVAHDRQDSFTIQQLLSRGARVYDREHYANFKDCARGLCSLAVDYFVLTYGDYFTGNVLSSVSQNVCFARLGRGKACHGTDPMILRLLAHATPLA